MLTVTFSILLAMGIMVIAYTTVIHRLLISKQMSDKYYKNFGLGILVFVVYITCAEVLFIGLDCNWMMLTIKANELKPEELVDLANKLVVNLNYMTGFLMAAIVTYLLMLLLVKSILKDIDVEFNKPKYRWIP
jgi:hypothetical protein